VDIEKGFHSVRTEPRADFAGALAGVELCRELLRDEEPHSDLLSLSSITVAARGQVGGRHRFWRSSSGVWPWRLHGQGSTTCRFAESTPRKWRDRSEHGGAVCAECAARSKVGVAVPPETLAALARVQAGQREPMALTIAPVRRELLNLSSSIKLPGAEERRLHAPGLGLIEPWDNTTSSA